MNTDHYKILHQCLATCLRADPGEIDPETNLLEEGILDSLDSMQFIFEIEKVVKRKLGNDEDFLEDKFTFSALSKMME
jgi:acyl carrier protein